MAKDGRTEGLFHKLKEPINGQPLGIAESYATAATCMELTGIPVVCAFSSENLVAVTKIMLYLFPKSLIILFADNDLHLVEQGKSNTGVLKAREAEKISEGRVVLVEPDFCDLKPNKEVSDWNDFVRINSRTKAKQEIIRKLANFEGSLELAQNSDYKAL